MATALIASSWLWRNPVSFRSCGHSHRTTTTTSSGFRVRCTAEDSTSTSTSGAEGGNKNKHVDTRIHWDNETDGWIGNEDGEESAFSQYTRFGGRSNAGSLLDLASDSHYRYMGVASDAEIEEIKSAYRRLSKLYHPDSTQLPIEIAAQKFMRLKDAYDTLSNEELRTLYDSRLANKIVSNTDYRSMNGYPTMSQQGYDTRSQRREERMDLDTLGGANMPLSGQALSALAFDLFVLFFCIGVIIFVAFFKNHAST